MYKSLLQITGLVLKSPGRKIFKKFFQIERETAYNAGGTGLGLYMVEQVVRFHKGKVMAQSDGLGRGRNLLFLCPEKSLISMADIF